MYMYMYMYMYVHTCQVPQFHTPLDLTHTGAVAMHSRLLSPVTTWNEYEIHKVFKTLLNNRYLQVLQLCIMQLIIRCEGVPCTYKCLIVALKLR